MLLLVTTAAPAVARAQTGPVAEVGSETIDLGTVGAGTSPHADFTIANRGASPLTLTLAAPPPTALTLAPDARERTVAPGASTMFRVTLDTFQAATANEWRLDVRTNDPAHPLLSLTVKADVRAFLDITPDSARFNFVQHEPEGGTSHLLVAVDDSPMDLLGVDSPVPFIVPAWRELPAGAAGRDPNVAGRQWRITLTIKEDAPVGPIGGYVVVRTTHPKQPRLFMPVTGFVRPVFAVTPQQVSAGSVAAGAAGDPPFATLIVKNFGSAPLQLRAPTSDVAGLTATIVPVDAGHVWRVELRMAAVAGAAPGAAFAGVLRIGTSSTPVPELTVPVEGSRR